jgi:hypothetical protein
VDRGSSGVSSSLGRHRDRLRRKCTVTQDTALQDQRRLAVIRHGSVLWPPRLRTSSVVAYRKQCHFFGFNRRRLGLESASVAQR